jgi:hypothetical protein
MIRQRVDRHGTISPLEPESELPGCTLSPSEIGVVKAGPVKKWMTAKREWDTKYASAKRRVQRQRAREMAQGYQQFGNGEVPPPSALAGRRKTGDDLREKKKERSWGMSLWSLWGSKHDEQTMQREEEAGKAPETTVASADDGAGARPLHDTETNQGKLLDQGTKPPHSRSRSRRRTVTDQHQTETQNEVDENTPAADLLALKNETLRQPSDDYLSPEFAAKGTTPVILIRAPTNEEYDLKRPKSGGIAFPFSIQGHKASASMTTLTSEIGVPPIDDMRTKGVMKSGVTENAADIHAANGTGSSTEEAKAMRENEQSLNGTDISEKGKGKQKENENENEMSASSANSEKAVENGQVVGAERPPLETFVTAASSFPTV